MMSMENWFKNFFLYVMLILSLSELNAETFHLLSGEKIEGKIIKETRNYIRVETSGGKTVKISKKNLSKNISSSPEISQNTEKDIETFLNGAKEGKTDLLKKKPQLADVKNNFGDTALILAADNGKLEAVKLLIQNKANIDEKNNEGETALMLACEL